MKHSRMGLSGVSYNVEVEGLTGDNRTFRECQYWKNRPVDNKKNAVDYANKINNLLRKLNMNNKIKVFEVCSSESNLILEF